MITYKYAIFDVDGTLLDSMGLWRGGLIEYARLKSRDDLPDGFVEKAIAMTAGRGIRYYKEITNDTTPDGAILDALKEYVRSGYAEGQPVKKGVMRALRALKEMGVKLYVLSATPLESVKTGLKVAGLDGFFEEIMSTEGLGRGKENPETFSEVLGHIGALPSETAMFEDALYSVNGAKGAGIHTVAFNDGIYNAHSLDELKEAADEYYDDFDGFCDFHVI